MKTSISIKGTNEIVNNLKKDNALLIEVSKEAANLGAEILKEGMKEDCPVDPEDDDEEHLRDSIHTISAKQTKNKVVAKAAAGKKTAIHVEFGTSKMDMHPFMRIQLIKHKDEIRKLVKDMVKGRLGL